MGQTILLACCHILQNTRRHLILACEPPALCTMSFESVFCCCSGCWVPHNCARGGYTLRCINVVAAEGKKTVVKLFKDDGSSLPFLTLLCYWLFLYNACCHTLGYMIESGIPGSSEQTFLDVDLLGDPDTKKHSLENSADSMMPYFNFLYGNVLLPHLNSYLWAVWFL